MSIVLVTSLSPRNHDAQAAALQSWKLLGLPIVSLNAAEEIDEVRRQFPSATIERVDRSAAEMLGRPLVLLDSVWEFARTGGHDMICLLNSDLLLRDASRFHAATQQTFDLLFGSRLDVNGAGDPTGTSYQSGFDYFLIPTRRAAEYPSSPFCLGAPWWDFWIPMIAIRNGWNTNRCAEPLFAHVMHPAKWSIDAMLRLGLSFAQLLLECHRTRPKDQPSDYREIFSDYFFQRMSHFRDLIKQGDIPPVIADALGHELMQSYAPAVAKFILNHSTVV